MEKYSDEQLTNSYLKGDEQALEVLIKRYLKPIYSFVYKNVGDGEAAEDITQEVFIKVRDTKIRENYEALSPEFALMAMIIKKKNRKRPGSKSTG